MQTGCPHAFDIPLSLDWLVHIMDASGLLFPRDTLFCFISSSSSLSPALPSMIPPFPHIPPQKMSYCTVCFQNVPKPKRSSHKASCGVSARFVSHATILERVQARPSGSVDCSQPPKTMQGVCEHNECCTDNVPLTSPPSRKRVHIRQTHGEKHMGCPCY